MRQLHYDHLKIDSKSSLKELTKVLKELDVKYEAIIDENLADVYKKGTDANYASSLCSDRAEILRLIAIKQKKEIKMNLIWIDLETTGLDFKTCEILQISAKTQDLSFNGYVPLTSQPGEPYALNMARNRDYTGIQEYPSEKELLWAFTKWTKGMGKMIPAGHNISKFDDPFLRARGEIYGIKFYNLDYHNYDTVAVAMLYQRLTGETITFFNEKKGCIVPSVSLASLVNRFGVTLQKAHNAMSDIEATMEVDKMMLDGIQLHLIKKVVII
jgi:DNA polymerase III epsilon subunit-like protein